MKASARVTSPQPLGNGLRALIVGFSMLCGSVSLIYPFGRDQGAYAYAGWVMLEGGTLYRDVFVFKPPMTAIVHGLAMGLFGVNTWAIRVLDLGWTAATSLVVAAIALELWNRRDAALAAGLLGPVLYYQIDYWMIAQTDGWMALPCAAAMWAVLRGGRALGQDTRRATVWWVAAGVLAGVALLFKYTAVTITIPMLAALGWVSASRGRRAWLGVPAMMLGGALALSACAFWLVCAGAWDSFVDSQLNLLPSYVGRRNDGNAAAQALVRLMTLERTKADIIPLFWAAPVTLVPALFYARGRGRSGWLGLGVVVIWWLAAVTNVVVQGKFFDYHYLPMLPPTALIAGLGLALLIRRPMNWTRRRDVKALGVAALLTLLIAVTPLGGRALDVARVAFGGQTIEEYIGSRREYARPGYNVAEIRRVADVLRRTTSADQRVFLWGYDPTINVRAKRHTVSRFLYNYPFRVSWGDPRYEAELMQALHARPPDVFVVSSGDRFPGITGTYKDSAAVLADFQALDTFVKERYRPAEAVGRYSIWRLQE